MTNLFQIIFALADSHYKLGNFEKAEEAYEKVLELTANDIEVWLDFSALYYEQNKIQEAIDCVQEGIKSNPDAAELYYRMVAYQFSAGKQQNAINFLEIGLAIDASKHEILFEYLPQLKENKVILEIINKHLLN